jgi:DNA polymerase-3 subunit chi
VTDIAFHFNLSDKLAYACRLLRKAIRSGVRVAVAGREAEVAELDRALWVFDSVEFLPHVRWPLPEGPVGRRLAAHTPVWLAPNPSDVPHREVLVNLGGGVPAAYDTFARLIELVGLEEEDRRDARRRWMHYRSCGHAVESIDAGQRAKQP